MKQSPDPTLSAHLLQESAKFMYYPQRLRPSRRNREAQKLLDDLHGRLLEWRKTFAPRKLDQRIQELINDPVVLDEFYCRDFLREIPGVVDRTRSLANLTLTDVSGESFVYLREAANCYIFGLPQAAVALARSAIEVPLRSAAARKFGNKAVADIRLYRLLTDFAVRGRLLSRDGIKRAHTVRLAADKVLHQEPTMPSEVLAVVEAARLVVVELSRPAG